VCTKKKKQVDKDKQERMDRLKTLLDSHNDHIKKLEMVMRLLDNESITVEQVSFPNTRSVLYFVKFRNLTFFLFCFGTVLGEQVEG
jgi:CCR4-NOT transcriptional regulation complex NOT5 subunit